MEYYSAIKRNIFESVIIKWTSLVAQTVKHLSTMQETRVQALGWEDPLEKAVIWSNASFHVAEKILFRFMFFE